jgi:hypothetical protein
VGDLVAGQRDEPGGRRVLVARGRGGDCEQGQGQHREGDPPVPGGPGADLVLVQPGQALACLEILLSGPPPSGDPDVPGKRDVPRRPAPVPGQLAGLAVAADQQPVPWAAGPDGDPGPVVVAVTLAPGPADSCCHEARGSRPAIASARSLPAPVTTWWSLATAST